MTAENPRALALGTMQDGTKLDFQFKNPIFHRVIKDVMIQSGDISEYYIVISARGLQSSYSLAHGDVTGGKVS